MTEFLKVLKENVEIDEEGDIDFYELELYDIPEEDGEELDRENFRVCELNDDYMVIVMGGDWQEGAYIKVEAINGRLKCTETYENYDGNVSQEQIINCLYLIESDDTITIELDKSMIMAIGLGLAELENSGQWIDDLEAAERVQAFKGIEKLNDSELMKKFNSYF